MFKSKKGFTLIELLVVIAIIGILATIVLVSLNSARVRARDARRLSDMQQMSLAMEMYYDTHTSAYFAGTTFASYVAALQGTTPPLIGATPADPGSGTYADINPGSASQYCFYVALEQYTPTQYSVASESGAGRRDAIPSALGATCAPNK